MKIMTHVVAAALLVGLTVGPTFAGIGVVDMDLIVQKYNKAQDLSTQAKTREESLQQLRDELQKQLRAGEKLSPVEKKNLEDKLNKQFAEKVKEYRDWSATQQEAIKSAFDVAVKQVSETKKLDLVLPKQAVLQGGVDVTNDVLGVMNK